MKKILIVLVLVLALVGCAAKNKSKLEKSPCACPPVNAVINHV
jgi:uncharacterized lipoprotein YajG